MHISVNYCIAKYEDESVIPASSLDNILTFSDEQLDYQLFSFLTGEKLEDLEDFYRKIRVNIANKIHETTNHLFFSTKINGCNYLYVSLENSIRSNANGYPLKNRLVNLCNAVKRCISLLDNNCVVFFSDSCGSSFDREDVVNMKNEMTWFEIRLQIEELLGIFYLGESSDTEDPNEFVDGISAFCTKNLIINISNVYVRHLLKDEFGSGCMGIEMKTGEIVWGVHFPLDFEGCGSDNRGAKAMTRLCDILDSHTGSICAMGNFNTIRGHVNDTVRGSISADKKFIMKDEITFFGSFFDTIKTDDFWTLL